MSNPSDPTEAVQSILREIVNDLEKTAAGLAYISREVQQRLRDSTHDVTTKVDLAFQEHKEYYDKMRTKIEALDFSSEGEK